MPSSLCCLAALAALGLVAASPAVHFPFNSQLPPVARISEAFSYTLSPQTFSSPSPIRYSLSGAPEWLSIDEKSGRLHGTPEDDEVPEGDVVGVTVNIVADDGIGSTAMSATLVVSRNSAPTVQIPLADQISNFGDQSAPGAIVSYPASPFAFSFDKKTFASKAPLNYYATSADSSPLPSWMIFDAANLTFSGQTPPFESLVQPPQTFGFQVVASDIVGFSASSIVFSVVVGSRKLTMENPVVQLNATRGSNVSYDGLASDIKLDGNRVEPSELTVSTDGLPDWLSIDNKTLGISGDVPRDAQSSNATATFRNGLSDSLSVQLQVLVDTGIFRRSLSDINATSDEAFELDLEPYLWESKGVSIEVKTEPDQDWLEVDKLVLSGTPPDSTEEQEEVRLTIKATVEDTGDSETQRATLRLLTSAETASTTFTTPTPSPTSTDDATGNESIQTPTETEPAAATGEFGDRLNGGQIALAVILPILIIATLVAIFILLRRRQEKKFRRIEAGDISGPVPGSFVQNSGPGGNEPSGLAGIKAFHTIPMAEPTYRPGQRGYLRAALRRMRSTRTTSSFDSDSQHSFTLAPPMLPRMRSTSENAGSLSRYSWLSEEGHLGLVGRSASSRRHSNNSILSVYDSLRDFPSRRRYMRAQTESSWRSTLDVTIPMMEEDQSSSSLHLNLETHASERPVTRAGDPEKRPFRRNESLFSVPPVPPPPPPPKPPVDPKTPPRKSIPEPRSALGSHPTHGTRFTPDAAAFMVYKDNLDNMDARDSQVTVATASVFGLDGLTREHSRGSELSHIRPVSRRSGASPWFGSRASMASRSTYTRRTHHDFASTSSIPSMPALPPSALSPSASEFASSSADQEPNWRTISRNLASSTADLQSVRDRRTTLDLAYQELIRQSPFYPLPPAPPPTAAPPPQPVKSMMRAVSNAQENRYVPMPLAKDKSWMGKGVSLRPRPLRQSDSNASLMSPSKWNFPLPPGKAGERPASSIRQVRSSAGSRRDLGMASEYNSARSSRVLPSEDSSGWTTDPASPRHVDRPGSRQRREGTFGTMGEDSPDTRGRRSGSREYPVYI